MSSHFESLHKSRPATPGDHNAGEVARKLHSMVQAISVSAVHSTAENRVHAMLIFAQAANGLLHLLARTIMPENTEKDPITPTATLVAALMAYHTAPFEHEVGHVQAEFSPLVVFEALKDAERLSGQQPDDRLEKTMCKVARECAADPVMIAQINSARSALHRKDAQLH